MVPQGFGAKKRGGKIWGKGQTSTLPWQWPSPWPSKAAKRSKGVESGAWSSCRLGDHRHTFTWRRRPRKVGDIRGAVSLHSEKNGATETVCETRSDQNKMRQKRVNAVTYYKAESNTGKVSLSHSHTHPNSATVYGIGLFKQAAFLDMCVCVCVCSSTGKRLKWQVLPQQGKNRVAFSRGQLTQTVSNHGRTKKHSHT